MPDRPQLPTVIVGGTKYPVYDANIALDIVERIADGELLSVITDRRNPHPTVTKRTFLFWVSTNPELARALRAAEQVSARAFEEEALKEARELAKAPGSPQKVSAVKTLIEQLRWSASRRDAQKYSEKQAVNVVVPVNISTPLDLGGNPMGKGNSIEEPNIYELTVTVPTPVEDAEFTEIPDEGTRTADLPPVLERAREEIKEKERVRKTNAKGPRKRVLKPRIKTDGDQ